MEVACRLALESLPSLPEETVKALRRPVETLCAVAGREIERFRPGLIDRNTTLS
jgi:hypothetical protein